MTKTQRFHNPSSCKEYKDSDSLDYMGAHVHMCRKVFTVQLLRERMNERRSYYLTLKLLHRQ